MEWEECIDKMMSDESFMAWLKEYDPGYEVEYSGTLLGMYDAFCAGRTSGSVAHSDDLDPLVINFSGVRNAE